MAVTHAKVSSVSDGGDTSLVRPSDWNADHVGVPVHSYLGYNTQGSSQENATSKRMYCKKITPASAGLLASVGAYVDTLTNGNTPYGISAALFADNSNAPGTLLAANDISFIVPEHPANTHPVRWLHLPISYYLAASTDYWIGFMFWTANTGRIYYDSSGSDQYFTSSSGAGTPVLADGGFYTITTGSLKYSIRGNFVSPL